MAELSYLRPVGYHTGDCGYCKNTESGASYYLMAKSLQPDHYQELMDRGWRRSGTLLYIPDAARSCCPHYTIRLPAAEFQSNRDQRQALHRFNRFVLGEKYIKDVAKRRPPTRESKKMSDFNLAKAIHEAEESNIDIDLEPDHRLAVSLEPDTYTDEKFQLFQNYQQNVHHESPSEITKSGFRRFLCDSPLERSNDIDKHLGSYHQCYRVDGRLIAMGVLDLLPHAVSGVYFIYHKDYEKWSPGKLSALRELCLTAESGYKYYYMGYYIHGCDKMKYKATYRQQYVLDYEDLTWNPLNEEMKQMMDARKYVSLSHERARQQLQEEGEAIEDAFALQYPLPTDAVASGSSLLEIGMPGVMDLSTFQTCIDHGEIQVHLGKDMTHPMQHLVAWDEGDDLDTSTIKGIVAEYAACVGPKVAREAIVDFAR